MPKRLKDLEITRVALVKRGSNPRADITFFKRHIDDEETSMPVTIPKLNRTKLSKEQVTQLDSILKAMDIKESELDLEDATPEEILQAMPESVQKAFEELTKQRVIKAKKKLRKQLTPPTPAPEEDEDDEEAREAMLKELTPAARKMVEESQRIAKEAQASAKAATEKAEAAQKKADAEERKREEAEFAKENIDVLKNFPGRVEDNGRVLYRIKKSLGDDDYKVLETLLKAGAEGIKKSGEEIGNADSSGSITSNAYEALQEKAADLMKADPKLTESKAFVKACKDNPDLHRQMEKDRGKRRRRNEDDE